MFYAIKLFLNTMYSDEREGKKRKVRVTTEA
jgi:hypothetical protein